MRTYKLVLSVIVLFFATTAMGQQSPRASKPAKGYYAIGNNAQQLTPSAPLATVPANYTGVEFSKGYYATGKNRQQLPSQSAIIPVSTKRPVVTKGYYSIGNNAEKLRN